MPDDNYSRPLKINTPADLGAAIVINEQAGAIGQAHLMRGLQAGRVCFLPLLPDSGAELLDDFIQRCRRRPAVLLIGDDDGFDRGPGGWSVATEAVAWAKAVLVHAAAAEVVHYEAAIVAAQISARALVIECSTRTLPAWTALVAVAPHSPGTLIIRPTNGGQHPVAPARETLQ